MDRPVLNLGRERSIATAVRLKAVRDLSNAFDDYVPMSSHYSRLAFDTCECQSTTYLCGCFLSLMACRIVEPVS